MSMETVKSVMKQAGWGFLATTDGTKAAVRPMGGWAWVDKELWCATGARSDKVRELKGCPQAEYCFCDREGRHVRVAGSVAVSTSQPDKDKLYQLVPALREHIDDPKSPEYVVLRMAPTRIRLMATTGMQYTEVALA
jgi:general stress protein 26